MSHSPPAFQRHQFRDFDPEQLREAVNGSDMEHAILAPGACSAMLQQWHAHRISVDVGYYQFPVVARGRFPSALLCISFCWGARESAWANGFQISPDTIQVYAEGSELLYRAAADTGWMVVHVDRAELQAAALRRLGRELPLPRQGSWRLSPGPGVGAGLADLVLAAGRGMAIRPGDRALAGHRLLAACVDAIASADSSRSREVQQRALHRFEIIGKADAAMRHLLGSDYSSDRLCRSLGVTERNLQLHFKEALGLTPKSWFQRLALNRAHAELLRRPLRQGLVTAVALDCGFEHLGRFARSYGELFGRPPSQTLRDRIAKGQEG